MTGLMDSKIPSKPSSTILGPSIPPDMVREDGSMKGLGYMGPIDAGKGKAATEKSISMELDGKEVLFPALVPTLTKKEAEYVATTEDDVKEWPQAIKVKAAKHAKMRMKDGLSPFASDADYPKTILSGTRK